MTAAEHADAIFAAPEPAIAARAAMEAEYDSGNRETARVLMGIVWALEWVEARRKAAALEVPRE